MASNIQQAMPLLEIAPFPEKVNFIFVSIIEIHTFPLIEYSIFLKQNIKMHSLKYIDILH